MFGDVTNLRDDLCVDRVYCENGGGVRVGLNLLSYNVYEAMEYVAVWSGV